MWNECQAAQLYITGYDASRVPPVCVDVLRGIGSTTSRRLWRDKGLHYRIWNTLRRSWTDKRWTDFYDDRPQDYQDQLQDLVSKRICAWKFHAITSNSDTDYHAPSANISTDKLLINSIFVTRTHSKLLYTVNSKDLLAAPAALQLNH